MSHKNAAGASIALIAFLLTACGSSAPTPTPTPVPPTETAIPSATSTPLPTATPTPSSTPTQVVAQTPLPPRVIATSTISAQAWSYFGAAIDCFNRNDYNCTIASMNEAIKIGPDFAGFYYYRGTAYSRKGNYDLAIADFNKALALEPISITNADVYNNRGNVYLKTGQLEPAINDFTRAIQLDPNFLTAIANRALAYRQLGRKSEAIADFETWLRLAPANNPNRAQVEQWIQELKAQ